MTDYINWHEKNKHLEKKGQADQSRDQVNYKRPEPNISGFSFWKAFIKKKTCTKTYAGDDDMKYKKG